MKGDKEYCKIVSYIKETRTYIVETIYGNRRGLLPMTEDQRANSFKLKKARQMGQQILLLCIDIVDGKEIYTSNVNENCINPETINSIVLSIPISNEDKVFQESLFNSLYEIIGDSIDTDSKYVIAKQLLRLNKSLKLKSNLYKDFFLRCNTKYAIKFWQEGVMTYCNNFWISTLWKESNKEEKKNILNKLGIDGIVENTSVTPIFDGIANELIKIMSNATESIKIAVAWFTNFDLFNSVKECLRRGIEVTLVTNNDLINNGGYCLNFNELIECGLKLHLVEYPEMLHYKFCIIDTDIVMTGSYNWTFYAEEINKEDAVFIKGNQEVINRFIEEFNKLTFTFSQVSEMPDVVPYRPQYDRSSFKEYISEELVLRTRKNIGNIHRNLLDAKRLAPNNKNVLDAIKCYGIDLNVNVATHEIEHASAQEAIYERQERTEELKNEQSSLAQQVTNIRAVQQNLTQRQEQHRQNTNNRLANATSETEREAIHSESQAIASQLAEQQMELQIKSETVGTQLEEVTQQIVQTNEEIDILTQTSTFVAEGGRGNLRINLKWATTDDLDLHVTDPDNVKIYFSSKQHICQGSLGQLDVDANAGSPYCETPQENIYWEDEAPIGKYKVAVHLYAKRSGNNRIPFIVTIIPGKGEPKTFAKWLETEKDIREIIEFEYNSEGITYLE